MRYAMKKYGGLEVQLHHSWPRYQMEVSEQFHAPAAVIFRCSTADTNIFPHPYCISGKITELPIK
jgi:hypothetical protein